MNKIESFSEEVQKHFHSMEVMQQLTVTTPKNKVEDDSESDDIVEMLIKERDLALSELQKVSISNREPAALP